MPRKDTTKAKHALIASFGGACQRCGYHRCLRALHFHHKDASEKAEWSRGRGNASQDEVTRHPERFILVCANCHAEIHDEEAKQHRKQRETHCLACGKLLTPDPARLATGRYVRKTDTCWLWTGTTMKGGYGVMQAFKDNGKPSPLLVHRLSYTLHHGAIPRGAQVLRTCQNPACVCPNHLVLKIT